MESILQGLIDSLKSASSQLHMEDARELLQAQLHDTVNLPDPKLSLMAEEALELLSSLRLLLEPRHLILADHFFGYMHTKALCAAVEMNIPDLLRSQPVTLPELAIKCNARPDRFRQVMRTLHNNGIFSYDAETDTYQNNAASTLLLSDHWTQWRNWVELYGNEFYDIARGIPAACKLDATRSPAQINYDTDDTMFKYFSDRGWIGKFHRTLSGGAIAQAPGILRDYPWGEVANGTVYDIGGGGGGLIALLLREYKTMKGAILEAPWVVEQAKANFHNPDGQYADVRDQIPPENLIAGDFFKQVPESDVYTIKWCLHDWNDEKAKIILANIRKAIRKSPRSRLIILESVLKDGHLGRMSRYADMNMMLAVGGQERNEKTWRLLAEETGWALRKIYPLQNAWPSAIEYVPVWATETTPQHVNARNNSQANTAEEAVRVPIGKVTANMRFLEPWHVSKGNPFVRIEPPPGFERMNFKWQDYPVIFQDARDTKGDFTLQKNGFAYFDDEIDQEIVDALRGNDKETIQKLYYPHVEKFAKKITGAPRVIIFDHTLRKRRLDLSKTQNDDGKEQPATMVHCDQSEKGALRRLRMHIGEEENIDELLEKRVEMINVWRPLNGPVQDWPLATMDYQTAKPCEMYPCDLLKGENEFRGQTVTFTHSDDQKWYYIDKQKTSEVTVIKIWDSKPEGYAQYCAHAAFNHPHAPVDVEPRESVEVRCLVLH